ncbi:MAG: efflux RND transporter periplasmic adaptor subunit [Rhodospirillaceae bacterium]|nr:efflux RND transporter periplasmic adaptor subunit [Rhodospirillaceae bacterium]
MMFFESPQRKILAGIAAATLVLGTAILAISPPGSSSDSHEHGADEHGHEESGGLPSHVAITPQAAKEAGVVTAVAAPAKIATTVTSMGSIVLDSTGHARVNARFTGLIREVRKSIGDRVAAGEALAAIESNESLQAYQVKSPIDGIVIARNKNVGEMTGPEPLFEVANLSRVWSELHIFPRDLTRVKSGQRVRLATPDGLVAGEGQIGALLPVAEASSQSVLARVALDNAAGLWRPGMAVRGDIVVSETDVPLAVRAEAIQTIDGKPVVFVMGKADFEVRPVLLGVSDGTWVEVQEGVYDGEVYAAQNSYLFKADIGKSAAEHEH